MTLRRTAPATPATMLAAALAVALLLGTASCGSDDKGRAGGGGDAPEKGSAATVTITPADGATGVAVSEEVGVQVSGGQVTEVTLTAADSKAVPGEMRPDGTSWVPASPLAYTTAYTASVTAKDTDGKAVTKTSKFTTMQRPGNRMEANLFLSNNTTYGQAMPIVVEFPKGGVPKAHRATVERRLFVKSEPPQPGVWHWDSDIQVEYRPKEFWQPGTKLRVRLGLGGLPIGDGRFGATDISVAASIDTVRRSIEVDNATKQLTAMQDGQVVRTAPVSLGKPSKPSFSGTMVVIERLAKTVFDSSTYGTPVNAPDGYRTDVQFAERLTWDGQFIHAAPWSVSDQGRRNVSHGCVNVSLDHGQWIYNWTRVGDPVVVKGTERRLNPGNGWTAWDMSWEDFAAGSALPPSGTGQGGAPSASPSGG